MLSYAARLLGARRFAMKDAITFCNGASGGGNRIMSGSANKLYKNPVVCVRVYINIEHSNIISPIDCFKRGKVKNYTMESKS